MTDTIVLRFDTFGIMGWQPLFLVIPRVWVH